jgi:hypothetical protein
MPRRSGDVLFCPAGAGYGSKMVSGARVIPQSEEATGCVQLAAKNCLVAPLDSE